MVLTYARFPLNKPELIEKWVHAVRRVDDNGKLWGPTKNHTLCSDHFLPTDYQIRPGTEKHYLKEGVVPTVFAAFPNHLQVSKGLKLYGYSCRQLHFALEKKVGVGANRY